MCVFVFEIRGGCIVCVRDENVTELKAEPARPVYVIQLDSELTYISR